MHPVIASEITDQKLASQPLTTLDEVLNTDVAEAFSKNTAFKARIAVMATVPGISKEIKADSVASLVKIVNKKSGASRDAKGALKKDEAYSLNLQLFVQDYSTQGSNQVVRVLLDEEGGFFRGIKLESLLKNKQAQEMVWQTLANLHKFNVWLECVLAYNKTGQLVMKDTEVKHF